MQLSKYILNTIISHISIKVKSIEGIIKGIHRPLIVAISYMKSKKRFKGIEDLVAK